MFAKAFAKECHPIHHFISFTWPDYFGRVTWLVGWLAFMLPWIVVIKER